VGDQRAEVRRQETGVRRQETEVRRHETGDRRQKSGDRRQETGDRGRRAEIRRKETGVRRQETGLGVVVLSSEFSGQIAEGVCARGHRIYCRGFILLYGWKTVFAECDEYKVLKLLRYKFLYGRDLVGLIL
jgi:hypothetical protein